MSREISSQPETSRNVSATKHIHDIRAFCKNPTFSGWKKLSNKIKFPFVEGSEYCIKNNKGNKALARKIVIFSEAFKCFNLSNLKNAPFQNFQTLASSSFAGLLPPRAK